jgi:hypothetical protein
MSGCPDIRASATFPRRNIPRAQAATSAPCPSPLPTSPSLVAAKIRLGALSRPSRRGSGPRSAGLSRCFANPD